MSEEFMVLADSGEDAIASCNQCEYAANTELAESRPNAPIDTPLAEPEQAYTPNIHSVDEQCKLLGISPAQVVKSLVVMADGVPAVLFVCGDDDLNEVKAANALEATDFRLADPAEALAATGMPKGFVGPKGLPEGLAQLVDRRAARLINFSSGAGRADYHWLNLNWERDTPLPTIADLRTAQPGEGCPRCDTGVLEIQRGIEVGHIFQLGSKYSEQWPQPLAPFDVAIVSIGAERSEAVAQAAEQLYTALQAAGLEPLLDDRDARPGVKFADMELIGIPHRIVVGERGIESGTLEYRARGAEQSEDIAIDAVVNQLIERIGSPSSSSAG
jgi:prolyl-tRNA synthetase